MGAGASAIPALLDEDEFKQLTGDLYSKSLFRKLRNADKVVERGALTHFYQTVTDAFLTHDWGIDELDRSNHDRVNRMNAALKARGLRTWFDEDKMADNIVEQMTDGIDSSRCVVVFITDRYMTKVAGKGPNKDKDNCLYEFQHASISKGPGKMIPVVMEPQCEDNSGWFGILAGHLRSKLYLSYTSDEDFENTADRLYKMILDVIKTTTDNISFANRDDGFGLETRRCTVIATEVGAANVNADDADDDTAAAGGSSIPVSRMHSRGDGINSNSSASASASGRDLAKVKAGNLRLNDLSVDQVGYLLSNLKMSCYAVAFAAQEIDGETLANCDTVEEVKELGVDVTAKAKYLVKTLAEYRLSGVPLEVLVPAGSTDDDNFDDDDYVNGFRSASPTTNTTGVWSGSRSPSRGRGRDSLSYDDCDNDMECDQYTVNNSNSNNSDIHNNAAMLRKLTSDGGTPTINNNVASNIAKPEAVDTDTACKFNCKWSRFVKFRGVSGPLGSQINGLYQLVTKTFFESAVCGTRYMAGAAAGESAGVNGTNQHEFCIYMRVGDAVTTCTTVEFNLTARQWEIRSHASASTLLGTMTFDVDTWNAHYNLNYGCSERGDEAKGASSSLCPLVPSIENAFQYENFYVVNNDSAAVEMKNMSIVSVFNSIEVHGATGVNAETINGTYDAIRLEPTETKNNPSLGLPFASYIQRHNPHICIDYYPNQNQWQIKGINKIGTDSACARLNCAEDVPLTFCSRDLDDFVAGGGGETNGCLSDGFNCWRIYDGTAFTPQPTCSMCAFRESVLICNCPGSNGPLVDGIYDPLPCEDGRSLAYQHRSSNSSKPAFGSSTTNQQTMVVEFNPNMQQWQVKPIESRGTNSCCASLATPAMRAGLVAFQLRLDWTVGCWRVYNGTEFAPAPEMTVTTALNCAAVALQLGDTVSSSNTDSRVSKPIKPVSGFYVPMYMCSTDSEKPLMARPTNGNPFPLLIRLRENNNNDDDNDDVSATGKLEPELPAVIPPDATVIEYSPLMSQWQVKPYRNLGSNESWALLNCMHMQLPDVGVVSLLAEEPELAAMGVVDNLWRVYDSSANGFVNDPDAMCVRSGIYV